VGEDRLVARVVTDASAPVPAQPGVTVYNVEAGVPRDLLVLLSTSEPADIVRRGFPSSRTDIFRSADVDIDAGGVLNLLLHAGLPQSYDASAYVGSSGTLRINQIAARDRARVKVGASILTPGNAPGVAAKAIILEAQGGSIGAAANPMRIDAGPRGGAVDLDARAGGVQAAPGDIVVRRATAGDVTLGGIVATGTADVTAAGNLLARNTATLVEGAAVRLTATGRIGTRTGFGVAGNLPVNVRTQAALEATAGTGLFVASDRTLTARSVGSTAGAVEIRVAQGDLILEGARNDPASLASLQIAPAVFARTAITTGVSTGPDDLILNVQNGRVLDAGSDTPIPQQGGFSVPDIVAGRMVLFTGGFGTAANPVETDVVFIGGNATAGLFATNDRRRQAAADRGLVLGNLTAPQGPLRVAQAGPLGFAPFGRVTSQGAMALSAGSATLTGDLTLDAPSVALSLPAGTLAMPLAADGRGRNLTTTGALTVEARRVTVGGLDAGLTAFAAGAITAGGDLTLRVTEDATLRILAGADVTVDAATLALRQLAAEGDATLRATGALRADRVLATGDATVLAGGTLRLDDIAAGATARIGGAALAGTTLMTVTARRLTGNIGAVPGGTRLRMQQATVVDALTFGNPLDAPIRVESLAGGLTLRGAITLAPARIEARGMTVEGTLASGDLDIVAIDGIDMGPGAQIRGGDVTIAVGGPLGGDFVARPANLTMHDTARITAQETLSIAATDTARITGLVARRNAPGVGIGITANRIVEAGDAFVDLSTNPGVTARLRANDLEADPLTGIETQIGTLDVVVGKGDILIREVDTITVAGAVTGQGRVDVFAFGDLFLAPRADGMGNPADTLAAPDSIVATAQGSLFTLAPPGQAVQIGTPRAFLGAIDGTLGSQAQPLALQAQTASPDALALFAGRHIVGEFAMGPVTVPLLAADAGLIDVRFPNGATPGIVTAPGRIDADGLGPFRRLNGVYDTRPTLAAVLESPRYPLRGTRAPGDAAFDATGIDAIPGVPLPPRLAASDGAEPPDGVILTPADPAATPADALGVRDRAAAIAAAVRAGAPLPGAPATTPGNPLQPFGTEFNRLRLSARAEAVDEDARRGNTRVTVADGVTR
jgi:hypothetical protein